MSGDKAMKKNLIDEFQIKGYWKLPNIDEEVAGILFYKQEEIVLELLGSFGDEIIFDFSISRYDTLFGFSDKGEQFSLYDVQLSKSPSHFPGFMTQTFIVREFIVGGHFENKDEIRFQSMIVYPTYLAEWIGRLHYKTVYKEENNRTYIKAIEWNDAPNFNTYIESRNFKLEEIDSGNINYKPQSFEWINTTGFKITPDEYMCLIWYQDVGNALRIFLTTLINKPIFEVSILFIGDFDERMAEDGLEIRKTYKYFYRGRETKIDEKFNPDKSLIKFSDIETNIGKILSNWFEFRSNHKVVSELYSEEFYKPIYVNSSFLNYVQALEIYHNKKTGYRNTKLEKRLRGLLEDLQPESLNFLIGNVEEKELFISSLVDTRNFLTHFDMGNKQYVITDSNDKFNVLMMLKGILAFIILKDLGINEEIIVKRFSEEWGLSYRIKKGKTYIKEKLNELSLK